MTALSPTPTPQPLAAALAAAVRAPSPHNSQPWLFEVAAGRVNVLLDSSRVLEVADPDGREARLSCGAALFNLAVAVRAAGTAARVDLVPQASRRDLVGTAWIGGCRTPTEEDRTLAGAVDRRRSNRRPFVERDVPPRVRHALVRAAGLEGGRLLLVEEPAVYDRLATLVRRAEVTQREDPAFVAELSAWTAAVPGRLDGVPATATGPPPEGDALIMLRDYHLGDTAVPRHYEQAPLLAVLMSIGDDPYDHVRAGQAMQRVLLTATAFGLSASFLSPPLERADSRDAVRALFGRAGYPQVILRLGYGYSTPATPRRPVSEVTVPPPGVPPSEAAPRDVPPHDRGRNP